MFDKAVIVTQKTRLEGLIERFNTRDQAKFWIEHMGLDFADYDREHDAYRRALDRVRREVEPRMEKVQELERGLLPTFLFSPKDLVVTVGRDGLVVNAAKYLDGQPIVAVNPDPSRWDGVLLPWRPEVVGVAVTLALAGRAPIDEVTMAEAALNDGQRLLAFNELMIGQKTHVSARYSLAWHGKVEEQSSSGVIVSTGAGSTGWLSSTRNMAEAVNRMLLGAKAPALPPVTRPRGDPRLTFVVREPFRSRSSGVDLAAGVLGPGDSLRIESHMPEGGVIFSDGVEADAIEFTSGLVATIHTASRKTRLVTARPAPAARMGATASAR